MQSLTAVLLIALSSTGFSYSLGSGSPVEKVVHLLTDMKKSLVADGANEKGSYEKHACWCTSMTSSKGAAIDQAKLDLKQLQTDIMRHSAGVSTASSEIYEHAQAMEENHRDQQTLSQTRQLENAAFTALRGEMGQALQSVKNALKMLNMAPQFLQSSQQSLSSEAASAVQSALAAIPERTLGALTAKKLAQLQDLGSAVEKGKYNPVSGSIVGILDSMSKQLSEDLAVETNAEDVAKASYAEVMKSKVKEIQSLQSMVNKKEAAKADSASDLAAATENFDDTQTSMDADIQFFNDAVASCQTKAGAWVTRQQMREEEIAGVNVALGILTSDDARALFGKAINAKTRYASGARPVSFLQIPEGQKQALLMLKALATKSQSVGLAKIAAHVRLASRGQFDTIIDSIDGVIGVVKDEQKADNSKKEECKGEYKQIAALSSSLTWSIEKNDAKIDKLQSEIDTSSTDKVATIASIADARKQIVDMQTQRTAENLAFVAAKTEDTQAITLLTNAKVALLQFYNKNKADGSVPPSVELMQAAQPRKNILRGDSAPTEKFSKEGSRSNQGNSIATLMQTLADGLQDEINVQTKVEASAVTDHTKAKKSASELVQTLIKKKDDLDTVISTRSGEKNQEALKRSNNLLDVTAQMNRRAQIQPDCDFMLNNWQSRFDKRKTEQEGLVQAKAFLAGLKKA